MKWNTRYGIGKEAKASVKNARNWAHGPLLHWEKMDVIINESGRSGRRRASERGWNGGKCKRSVRGNGRRDGKVSKRKGYKGKKQKATINKNEKGERMTLSTSYQANRRDTVVNI